MKVVQGRKAWRELPIDLSERDILLEAVVVSQWERKQEKLWVMQDKQENNNCHDSKFNIFGARKRVNIVDNIKDEMKQGREGVLAYLKLSDMSGES